MKRFAFTVRPTTESREPRAPWDLVRLLLGAFGWTLESIEEVQDPAAPVPPPKTEAEIAAEIRASLLKFQASLRQEREAFREAIAQFDRMDATCTQQIEAAGAPRPELTPLPVNVFQLGACVAQGGKHSLQRVAVAGAGPSVLKCARCERLAWVGGVQTSAEEVPAETGEVN